MVCLAVYMQQILEQYEMPFSGSREPTQATNTTVLGSVPSEGRNMAPPVGPDALARRSNCMPSMTSATSP